MESMSSYKAQVEKYGTPISDAQFKALRSYAESRNIRLSGFKDFVGDIKTIKLVIDDIAEIARDFPKILDGKEGAILELDYNLGSDFATTVSGHIIHLNGGYFADVDEMQEEYAEGVAKRRFVKGTDWRAIARHETGHVVANLYHINPMEIAHTIKAGKSRARILEDLEDDLSLYSAEYEDGREIISECFSAFYSKTGNPFAEDYIALCKEVVVDEVI